MKRFFAVFAIGQVITATWITAGHIGVIVVFLFTIVTKGVPFLFNLLFILISIIALVSLILQLRSWITKGYLYTEAWFLENGIRTEAVFEKINEKNVPISDTGATYREYILQAKGTNPITNNEQIYEQRCRARDILTLQEGETKITVYLHPKFPKTAYRLFIQS